MVPSRHMILIYYYWLGIFLTILNKLSQSDFISNAHRHEMMRTNVFHTTAKNTLVELEVLYNDSVCRCIISIQSNIR